jgi:hypothetical protein|tara:strand:+ start:932 stop:1228 length:297 start_codon:yes stop_codon:yes gene_type:complete
MRLNLSRNKKENSKMKRAKITPAHGPSWYLKWLATIVILIGAAFNSLEIVPVNFYFMLTGTGLWFIVGMLWFDRALITLNAVIFGIHFIGIILYYSYR